MKGMHALIVVAGALSLLSPGTAKEEPDMPLVLTSPTFEGGKPIPKRFTCDGDDISPQLRWAGAPEGTASFVLIMDDPDAPVGTWDHWVVFGLPGDLDGLPEAASTLPGRGTHGRNSWGRSDYGGPCPPGGTHRYFFRLYALDSSPELPPGAEKQEVLRAMEGRILAEAELMGTYSR